MEKKDQKIDMEQLQTAFSTFKIPDGINETKALDIVNAGGLSTEKHKRQYGRYISPLKKDLFVFNCLQQR